MIEIHIDADDAEVYAKVDTEDKKLKKSFIVEALTNALAMLDETNTKAIVFVVAKNLEQNDQYQILLKQFLRNGHAIGNHSYTHAENFHRLKKEEQIHDVQLADQTIRKLLDYDSKYFRGPGYSSSHAIQKCLLQMGYKYDCTKIPLFYSSFLDLYFKISKNKDKRIPSILRLKDQYFALTNPISGIEEIKIHPNKLWGIPNYSTWMFQNVNKDKYLSRLIKKSQQPFLFHAIDFLDYSNSRSNIPALRIDSCERFRIIREVILEINSKKS